MLRIARVGPRVNEHTVLPADEEIFSQREDRLDPPPDMAPINESRFGGIVNLKNVKLVIVDTVEEIIRHDKTRHRPAAAGGAAAARCPDSVAPRRLVHQAAGRAVDSHRLRTTPAAAATADQSQLHRADGI